MQYKKKRKRDEKNKNRKSHKRNNLKKKFFSYVWKVISPEKRVKQYSSYCMHFSSILHNLYNRFNIISETYSSRDK